MLIEVVHVVNGSTQTHTYTCKNASRQLAGNGLGNIMFVDGPGRNHKGRPVLSALYSEASCIITYDEDEIITTNASSQSPHA